MFLKFQRIVSCFSISEFHLSSGQQTYIDPLSCAGAVLDTGMWSSLSSCPQKVHFLALMNTIIHFSWLYKLFIICFISRFFFHLAVCYFLFWLFPRTFIGFPISGCKHFSWSRTLQVILAIAAYWNFFREQCISVVSKLFVKGPHIISSFGIFSFLIIS